MLIRAIAVASLCVLACPGCSRHEQTEKYEGPLADDPAATEQSSVADARSSTGGLQLQALNPTPEESIRYSVPEGWSPTQASGRTVSFKIKEDALEAHVTVMGLPGTVIQRLLPNVNSWRRQIGLEETTQEDLDAALEAIDVDGRRGRYIRLLGPADTEQPQSMLVVLVGQQGNTWFFRMRGDSRLVQHERKHFEEFVKSVTFVAAGEVKDEPADAAVPD
jgi:hypothetical protein